MEHARFPTILNGPPAEVLVESVLSMELAPPYSELAQIFEVLFTFMPAIGVSLGLNRVEAWSL
ncbi:GD15207 [Drosophila simulans]|uniref:GD15207 n=1 Tax=Drosophila simulans TaxID=7240 RepID=B4NSN7_DROSI|nr:GD15207 [Drosophila simulans]